MMQFWLTRIFEKGEAASAIEKINLAIRLAPDVGSFYIDRSVYRRRLGSSKPLRAQRIIDLLKAREIFSHHNVPEYDGNVRFVGRLLADIYDDNKEYAKQKSELLRVIKNDPSDSIALMQLADCCMCMSEPKEGLIYADRAVAADVLNAGAYRSRAWAQIALEDFQEAIKNCTLSLLIEPKNEWALFQKSKCLFFLREYSNARKVVCELLTVAPKNLDGTYGLTFLDYRLGNYNLAMQEADAANAVKKRATVDCVKAHCLVSLKRFAEAKTLANQAIAEKFDDNFDTADGYICLAEAEIGLKKNADAIRHLHQALKLQPSFTYANTLLKGLKAP